MSERRSRDALERALTDAASSADRARAHFAIALFHDNNSREAEAIPHYRAALEFGLSGEIEAQCHAWLASSLHKTGHSSEALQHVEQARGLADDVHLQRFLDGLQRRVRRRLADK